MKCLYLVVRSLDPTGKGADAMDEPMEARTQRFRAHLRRTNLSDRPMTTPDQLHRYPDSPHPYHDVGFLSRGWMYDEGAATRDESVGD